ncbi:Cobalt ECF transporter T component CbiQ [Hyella patelloides LEGE 07179]|uniref:Cobalt ECF transporter T component CbiQ n=1 Tax=Hyella patelloides LEGE 07179 TaxID=945734 RepID=A0A563VJ27_9CYAN|nr:cobalt ECF transporter T component CbiQ [Hyella patelloides]VEP11444.1 Cobalt ECF transporter T component CbiQ [Hyella patelloides LEGE 07179]
MHLWLDNLSYNNRLRQLPPEHKLGFALVGLTIALISHPPVQIAIALWMSVWIVGYARIPFNIYGGMLSLAIGFWVTSIPALLISGVAVSARASIQADALSGLTIGSYYLYLSYQGFVQAGLIFARTLATVSCLYFVLFTTPFTELLQVLRRIGCPVVLTELLLLMYRFIFLLLSTARELWIAQQSRNGYRTRQRWIYSLSLLIRQLFQKTMKHYQQFVLSTAARGFNGQFRVWSSQSYQASQRYTLEASLGCLVLVIGNFLF